MWHGMGLLAGGSTPPVSDKSAYILMLYFASFLSSAGYMPGWEVLCIKSGGQCHIMWHGMGSLAGVSASALLSATALFTQPIL